MTNRITTAIAITKKTMLNWGNIPKAAPVLVMKVNLASRARVGNKLQDSPSGIYLKTRNFVAWSKANTIAAIPIMVGKAAG
jgi:hypothetical protein